MSGSASRIIRNPASDKRLVVGDSDRDAHGLLRRDVGRVGATGVTVAGVFVVRLILWHDVGSLARMTRHDPPAV